MTWVAPALPLGTSPSRALYLAHLPRPREAGGNLPVTLLWCSRGHHSVLPHGDRQLATTVHSWSIWGAQVSQALGRYQAVSGSGRVPAKVSTGLRSPERLQGPPLCLFQLLGAQVLSACDSVTAAPAPAHGRLPPASPPCMSLLGTLVLGLRLSWVTHLRVLHGWPLQKALLYTRVVALALRSPPAQAKAVETLSGAGARLVALVGGDTGWQGVRRPFSGMYLGRALSAGRWKLGVLFALAGSRGGRAR